MVKNAAVSGMDAYRALCAEAEADYLGFWAKRAREFITWKQPFTQVLDESNAPFFKWCICAMQACARIGAIHSIVFGGFSAQSLRDRINDAGAAALITSDGQFRGGKAIPLKPIADETFSMGGCESVKNVIVFKRTGGEINMIAGRDTWLHDAVANQSDVCEPEWVEVVWKRP